MEGENAIKKVYAEKENDAFMNEFMVPNKFVKNSENDLDKGNI